jgi:hypothetical protein
MEYDGTVLWADALSGFMNHDVWCEDITGDGADEILVANADGAMYCLDRLGQLQWRFAPVNGGSLPPMYAVCVVCASDGTPYVVCGGFDKNIYYLSATGALVKTIESSAYSQEKPWGDGVIPPIHVHTANFLRKIPQPDGSDVLIVHGTISQMQAQGSLYQFKPLAERPFRITPVSAPSVIGDLRVCDPDGDGNYEVLLGTSGLNDQAAVRFNPVVGEMREYPLSRIGGFGYRVTRVETVPDGRSFQYLLLCGTHVVLVPPSFDPKNATAVEGIPCRQAFNDIWKDAVTGKIILASDQSGGSCIHILDPANSDWKRAYANLTPSGKIAKILANTAAVRAQLQSFRRPSWERDPLPVYLMSESVPAAVEPLVNDIKAHYASPVFLNGFYTREAENWDRTCLENDEYREKRDRRRRYTMPSEEAVNLIRSKCQDQPGIAFWGGHGNAPFMFSRETLEKAIAVADGKKTVLIYPELEQYDNDFAWVMENHFYPLASYCQKRNAYLYVRSKHTFWQSIVYLPLWSRLLSGEFADVFVPAMEETTDKSMELSVAARMGIWASGAVNQWGARCARDNTSFDRQRQFSHQTLPNHFLRQMVYNVSCGARYIDNFPVDQSYMSLLWELIAKGALYVPKRSEIVSFSPVHLSMKTPDERYLNEGNNVKWLTFYDEKAEVSNPMVFGRLNGSWPGAPVTEWDFSRYAAGVKERRLNFLPPYENGLVLITPPQAGVFADTSAPRGKLTDHLHPLYRNITKEYITDGRDYYSADGKETFAAQDYYRIVEADIKAAATRIPLTVSGNVAWVAATSAPRHIRLTLVDSGYINPGGKTAVVAFHTVTPVALTDILTDERIAIENGETSSVPVPCGLFRFLDVEVEGKPWR